MIRCAAVGLLAATWLLGSAYAAPPLADRLPAESILYVGWSGRNLAFDGSMLGQLLAEPSVADAVAAWGQALVAGARPSSRQQLLEHELTMLAIAWQHRTALCILPTTEGPPAPGHVPLPGMILLIDLGKDQPAFAEHLEALIRSGSPALAISEATTADVTYRTFRVPGVRWPLAYGYKGDMLFVTVGTDTPAKLISVLSAASPNLAAAPTFTAAYAEVAGENEQWVLYGDMPNVLALLRGSPAGPAGTAPATPATGTDKLIEALGLAKVTYVAAATRVIDRGMYTRIRIATALPHRGVPGLLAGAPLSPAMDLAGAPGDALALLACRFSISTAWQEVRQVLEALGERRLERLDQTIVAADRRLGLALQEDVLANLAEPWMLVSAPSLGGVLTGTAMVTSLKAPGRLREQLADVQSSFAQAATRPSPRDGDAFAGRKAPSLQSSMVGLTAVAYLQLPGEWPIAPAGAVHENQFILAGWPQVVRNFIERDANSTLAAQPTLQGALRYITGKPTLLAYLDTPRLLGLAYGRPLARWTDMSNRQAREGTFIRPGWLPSLTVLNRFVGPSVMGVSVDDRGILIEDYGPIAAVPTAAAALLIYPHLPQPPPQPQPRRRTLEQWLDDFVSELSRLPRPPRPPATHPATTTPATEP